MQILVDEIVARRMPVDCRMRIAIDDSLVDTTEYFQAHGFMELVDTEYVGDN